MKRNSALFVFSFLASILFCFTSCSKDGPDNIPDDEPDGDPVGTVYFEANFDKMVWGGDYVANERGSRPFFIPDPDQNNLRVVDESREPEDSTPGTDGSMDFFEYMAPSYFALTEFEGWDGNKVYERPGYIKIGTSASRDAFVATPVFSEIAEDRVNLKVTFKMAIWANASQTVYVEVSGGGAASVQSVPVTSSTSWESKEFSIINATSNTRIRFVSDPTMDGRFFLDDLVVSKAE